MYMIWYNSISILLECNFIFSLQKEKGDKTHWRCAKRAKTMNCPATVIQNGDIYKEGTKQHIHPSEPGVDIAVKIQAEVIMFYVIWGIMAKTLTFLG